MANGGGSRTGGFLRGVLMGLVVCAIIAVALSLWAPLPEDVAPEQTAAPGAGSAEGTAPDTTTEPGTAAGAGPETGTTGGTATGSAPAAPAEGTGAGGQGTVSQPTAPQPGSSQTGASAAGAGAAGGAAGTGSNFSDEPPAATGGATPAPTDTGN
jgi:hypothetical protein